MNKKALLIIFSMLFANFALAETASDYDWSKVLTRPSNRPKFEGNQILHFNSKNKHYLLDSKAQAFVETYLLNALSLTSDAEVLRFASESVTLDGGYLEMGVCTGKTVNYIAALNPTKKIYGFDSFEGLPEDWVKKDRVIPKGTFAFKNPNEMPYVLHNVYLYKGWFKESIPAFKRDLFNGSQLAFLHIDCDLYSSTVDALRALEENIVPGTIIVFDEFYNYPGAENHEFKAFMEFLERTELQAEYLAYNAYHEQVVVRITH
ncbi:MAG: class I SAM-dependent methyltransferase [Chlamydiia bacterium]|nr:class I SAM-dependent methyltransferase [Chlamydiia bacterium]